MNSAIKLFSSSNVFQFNFGRACRIHNWVRPVRYVLRRRRIVEHEKFPERAKPPRRSAFSDWNYRSELYAFGKRLGEDFKQPLLIQAFVDKSYVHTEIKKREELGLDTSSLIEFKDNQQLAANGQKLLHETLAMFLRKEFPKLPNEGVESVISSLLNPATLGKLSFLIGTKDLLQCSEYPPPDNVLATAFCAVVSVLEQSSGREKAEKFILDFVASHICGKDLVQDFWDIEKPWQMLLQLTKPQMLEPRLLREGGRNTLLSVFVVGIYDENKKLLGTGAGETIDISQEMAARDVLRRMFGIDNPIKPFQFQSANFPKQLIPHVRNP